MPVARARAYPVSKGGSEVVSRLQLLELWAPCKAALGVGERGREKKFLVTCPLQFTKASNAAMLSQQEKNN
jgi:hypothetical protein